MNVQVQAPDTRWFGRRVTGRGMGVVVSVFLSHLLQDSGENGK
jgi:hypothetical protein